MSDTETPLGITADASTGIAICGAGPVGLTLAAHLVKRGVPPHSITLIDAKTVAQAGQDPRSIALSYGSRQILEEAGAWPIAATPIHDIHVSRRNHFGRTLIDRAAQNVPALGYVSRYGAIVGPLATVCARLGINMLRPAQVRASSEHSDGVVLQLTDLRGAQPQDMILHAKLLVQAEGGLFGAQAEKSRHRDYVQTAVIAQVRVETPIPNRAFERFTDEGPLALLPQEEDAAYEGPRHSPHNSPRIQAYALVWCVKPDTARALLALDDAAFLAQLGAAFGARLGHFTATTARQAFPLGLNANPAPSRCCVAIGNAAQTLHPVAGQGLNLGLRDAAVLARLLAHDASPASVQRFEQMRQGDRALTVRLTDTMARIFTSGNPHSLTQGLLGISLGLMDALDPAKDALAQLMMFGRR
jgi:2-octaprenyl-6-methoxyphenol hydroxylase